MAKQKSQLEETYIDEIADLLGKKVNTVQGYIRDGLIVWHKKDTSTGTRNIFYVCCVLVRWNIYLELRNNGHGNKKKAIQKFKKLFGPRDEKLILLCEKQGSTKDEIVQKYSTIIAKQ